MLLFSQYSKTTKKKKKKRTSALGTESIKT